MFLNPKNQTLKVLQKFYVICISKFNILYKNAGIPPNQRRLIYGQQLEDKQTICNYSIKKGIN